MAEQSPLRALMNQLPGMAMQLYQSQVQKQQRAEDRDVQLRKLAMEKTRIEAIQATELLKQQDIEYKQKVIKAGTDIAKNIDDAAIGALGLPKKATRQFYLNVLRSESWQVYRAGQAPSGIEITEDNKRFDTDESGNISIAERNKMLAELELEKIKTEQDKASTEEALAAEKLDRLTDPDYIAYKEDLQDATVAKMQQEVEQLEAKNKAERIALERDALLSRVNDLPNPDYPFDPSNVARLDRGPLGIHMGAATGDVNRRPAGQLWGAFQDIGRFASMFVPFGEFQADVDVNLAPIDYLINQRSKYVDEWVKQIDPKAGNVAAAIKMANAKYSRFIGETVGDVFNYWYPNAKVTKQLDEELGGYLRNRIDNALYYQQINQSAGGILPTRQQQEQQQQQRR